MALYLSLMVLWDNAISTKYRKYVYFKFQWFVAFSLNYKKESFFKAQIKMIISSTSAFHFSKFETSFSYLYLSVWPLHVKCTLARHLSHSRIRFEIILVYYRSSLESNYQKQRNDVYISTTSWQLDCFVSGGIRKINHNPVNHVLGYNYIS